MSVLAVCIVWCKKRGLICPCFKPKNKYQVSSFIYKFHLLLNISGAQLGRGVEGGLSCPFLKIKKIVLIFEKKAPDCDHLWVKFPIENVGLKVFKRKKLQHVSLRSLFFLCFWRNVYRIALVPRNLAYLEKYLGMVCLYKYLSIYLISLVSIGVTINNISQ